MDSPPLPNEFPVLETSDFVLRRIELTDAPTWYAHLIDPEVTEYTSTEIRDLREIEETILTFQSSFTDKTAIRWAITRREDGGMIGDTGFNRIDAHDRSGVIGYQLAREHWGRGVATVSVNEVLRFGFERLALHRVEATVHTQNQRSARVLQKLGFRREGTLRHYRFARGVFFDTFIFGLLRDEWRDVSR
jgi:ribosomal-protein-alanine N-acetyltransferase